MKLRETNCEMICWDQYEISWMTEDGAQKHQVVDWGEAYEWCSRDDVNIGLGYPPSVVASSWSPEKKLRYHAGRGGLTVRLDHANGEVGMVIGIVRTRLGGVKVDSFLLEFNDGHQEAVSGRRVVEMGVGFENLLDAARNI